MKKLLTLVLALTLIFTSSPVLAKDKITIEDVFSISNESDYNEFVEALDTFSVDELQTLIYYCQAIQEEKATNFSKPNLLDTKLALKLINMNLKTWTHWFLT